MSGHDLKEIRKKCLIKVIIYHPNEMAILNFRSKVISICRHWKKHLRYTHALPYVAMLDYIALCA